MRRSRGGLTTKIRILADALGRPLRFSVTAGQVGDITQASALLNGQTDQAVLGDKAYDSNALRATIAKMEAEAVIPSNPSRKIIIPHDPIIYKRRHRKVLQSPNTPTLCYPIRASNYPLHSIHPSRCNHDLDTLNVGRS
ncbi:transposase [Rhizobium laguerreae]|uniref:transposase n=1 Tax=Rhizobium laguerreae TaxID=1076926 RepID=UPI0019FC5D5E|nr:transposase [Rhizobium laguerreae]